MSLVIDACPPLMISQLQILDMALSGHPNHDRGIE
jgi:hypothetical protein